MVDLGSFTSLFPSKDQITSGSVSTFQIFTWFLIFTAIFIALGAVIYFILKFKKYRNIIIIWEKINGNWEITGKDKAIEVPYGKAGDTVFITLKKKKYLPRPTIQTGKRTYWYAIREDGEWINIGMEDVDMNMKRARAKYLHPEMRYARTALQKGLRDRYEKQKFMEKYGYIIIPLASFIIVALFLWFLADKILTAADRLNTMITTSAQVMDKANEVVAALDRACTRVG